MLQYTPFTFKNQGYFESLAVFPKSEPRFTAFIFGCIRLTNPLMTKCLYVFKKPRNRLSLVPWFFADSGFRECFPFAHQLAFLLSRYALAESENFTIALYSPGLVVVRPA